MTTTTTVLPGDFSDLEPFAGWALATEPQRWDKRMSSTMDQMQDFYDTAMARLEDGMAYIDRFDLTDLPDDAQHLLWLFCSLVTVSFPIEAWRQPNVPDAGASTIDCISEFPY